MLQVQPNWHAPLLLIFFYGIIIALTRKEFPIYLINYTLCSWTSTSLAAEEASTPSSDMDDPRINCEEEILGGNLPRVLFCNYPPFLFSLNHEMGIRPSNFSAIPIGCRWRGEWASNYCTNNRRWLVKMVLCIPIESVAYWGNQANIQEHFDPRSDFWLPFIHGYGPSFRMTDTSVQLGSNYQLVRDPDQTKDCVRRCTVSSLFPPTSHHCPKFFFSNTHQVGRCYNRIGFRCFSRIWEYLSE